MGDALSKELLNYQNRVKDVFFDNCFHMKSRDQAKLKFGDNNSKLSAVWDAYHLKKYIEFCKDRMLDERLSKYQSQRQRDSSKEKEEKEVEGDINDFLKKKVTSNSSSVYSVFIKRPSETGFTLESCELVFDGLAPLMGFRCRYHCFSDFLKFCAHEHRKLPLQNYEIEKKLEFHRLTTKEIRKNIDWERLESDINALDNYVQLKESGTIESNENSSQDQTLVINSSQTIIHINDNNTENYNTPYKTENEGSQGKEQVDFIGDCPFKGLDHFSPEDANIFFGRDKEIEELAKQVRSNAFTAVLGASGCGKSSLALAGLIPTLCTENDSSEVYFPIHFQPYDKDSEEPSDIFYSFFNRLIDHHSLPSEKGNPEYLEDEEDEKNTTNYKEMDLSQCIRNARRGEASKLSRPLNKTKIIIVIDQFEEIFTQFDDHSWHQDFLNLLVSAQSAAGDNPVCSIVITLRYDFLEKLSAYKGFFNLISENSYLVKIPDTQNLRKIIESPLLDNGAVRYDDHLVEEILRDAERHPKSFPLIQYTLEQLWHRQVNGVILLKEYRDLGGILKAHTNKADEFYNQLQSNEQKIAQVAFAKMVSANAENTIYSKQLAIKGKDLTGEEWEIVEQLASSNYRLVAVHSLERNKLDDHSDLFIEFSHDIIVSSWNKISEWFEKYKSFKKWLDYISVREMEESFLSGRDLANAEEFLEKYSTNIPPPIKKFIGDSLQMESEKHNAERHKLEEQINMQRKGARLLKGILLAFSVLVSYFVYSQYVLQSEKRKAVRERDLAITNELRYLSVKAEEYAEEGKNFLAAKLALKALERKEQDEGLDYIEKSLSVLTDLVGRPILHKRFDIDKEVYNVALHPNKKNFVSGGDGEIFLWDLKSGKILSTVYKNLGEVEQLSFNRSGSMLLATMANSDMLIFDSSSILDDGKIRLIYRSSDSKLQKKYLKDSFWERDFHVVDFFAGDDVVTRLQIEYNKINLKVYASPINGEGLSLIEKKDDLYYLGFEQFQNHLFLIERDKASTLSLTSKQSCEYSNDGKLQFLSSSYYKKYALAKNQENKLFLINFGKCPLKKAYPIFFDDKSVSSSKAMWLDWNEGNLQLIDWGNRKKYDLRIVSNAYHAVFSGSPSNLLVAMGRFHFKDENRNFYSALSNDISISHPSYLYFLSEFNAAGKLDKVLSSSGNYKDNIYISSEYRSSKSSVSVIKKADKDNIFSIYGKKPSIESSKLDYTFSILTIQDKQGEISVYNAKTGSVIFDEIKWSNEDIIDWEILDSRNLIIALRSGKIFIFDFIDRKVVKDFKFDFLINQISLSSDMRKLLVEGASSSNVNLVDFVSIELNINNGSFIEVGFWDVYNKSFASGAHPVRPPFYRSAGNGRCVLISKEGCREVIFNKTKAVKVHLDHSKCTRNMVIKKKGFNLKCKPYDSDFKLIDINGKVLSHLEHIKVNDVFFSLDQKYLLLSLENETKIFSSESGDIIFSLPNSTLNSTYRFLSRNSDYLVSESDNGFRIHDIATGKLIFDYSSNKFSNYLGINQSGDLVAWQEGDMKVNISKLKPFKKTDVLDFFKSLDLPMVKDNEVDEYVYRALKRKL